MPDKTAISWTDATWNPTTGCTHVSPGTPRTTMTYLPTRFPSYLDEQTQIQIRKMALCRRWGHLNIYTCKACHQQLITTDLDEGTTPFITRCRRPGCAGESVSEMYRVDPRLQVEPTHGWFRPETLDGLDAQLVDHVRSGGLILRVLE